MTDNADNSVVFDRSKFIQSFKNRIEELMYLSCEVQNPYEESLENFKKYIFSIPFFEDMFFKILFFCRKEIGKKVVSEDKKKSLLIDLTELVYDMCRTYKNTFCIVEIITKEHTGSFLLSDEKFLGRFLKHTLADTEWKLEESKLTFFENGQKIGFGFFEHLSQPPNPISGYGLQKIA